MIFENKDHDLLGTLTPLISNIGINLISFDVLN